MPAGEEWSPRLAVYGDLGSVNAQSLARLELDASAGMYDAIIHVGKITVHFKIFFIVYFIESVNIYIDGNYFVHVLSLFR